MNKKIHINEAFFIICSFGIWFFVVNFGSVYFETAFRDNTIYFPLNYGFENIKENPFSQVQYDWSWSNARWFNALLESHFLFKHINSLQDLHIAKFIGIILNIISAIIFYCFSRNINSNKLLNITIALGIFSLPGFIYWNFLGGLNQHITFLMVTITGYILAKSNNKFIIFFCYLLFFICASSYTPLIFLILIFPVYIILFDENNLYNKKKTFYKFAYFLILSCIIFFIFKTFLIEYFYNLIHEDILNIYPFFENTHKNYNTNTSFSGQALVLLVFKIFLYLTIWLKSDFNFWNIYASWIPVLIFLILIVFLYKKRKLMLFNYKNSIETFEIIINKSLFSNTNIKKIFYVLILYLLPILAWLPLGSTLIVYRVTASTSAIIFMTLIFILERFDEKKYFKLCLYFLLLSAFVFSSHNSFYNAKNSYLEFNFVASKLKNINKNTKHIHVIQPIVGLGYTGLTSVNEEFNRPNLLTWQENSRFLNAALSTVKNSKFLLDDCETRVYEDKNYNFPIYKNSFPSNWDIANCIKNLEKNFVLVTYSHPHKYVDNQLNNHSHLYRRSRYTDLTKGLDLNENKNFVSTNTIIIDLNEIHPDKPMTNLKKKGGIIEILRSKFLN